MKINRKQMDAITALSGQKRYEHFVKVIVDREEVWGLYRNGWALAATGDEQQVFPLWPAKEYAQLCAKREWEGYEPESLDLEDFINELLPKLREDNLLPGIFYTPAENGVTPIVDQVLADVNNELENY